MRKKCEKVAPDPSKRTVPQNHDGICEASSEGRSPSQGGLVREFGRKVSVVIIQHAGGSGTPAHWDAPRGFARQRGGPDIENLFKTFPRSLKIHPDTSQNPPEAAQNWSKRPLGPLPRPMLEKWWIWSIESTFKKCPKDGPDRANPLPNGAQDHPKSTL